MCAAHVWVTLAALCLHFAVKLNTNVTHTGQWSLNSHTPTSDIYSFRYQIITLKFRKYVRPRICPLCYITTLTESPTEIKPCPRHRGAIWISPNTQSMSYWYSFYLQDFNTLVYWYTIVQWLQRINSSFRALGEDKRWF